MDFHVSPIFVNLSLLFLSWFAATRAAHAEEQAVVAESKPVPGRLEMDAQGTIFFRATRRGNIITAAELRKVIQTNPPTITVGTSPAHRISLWGNEQFSGSVQSIDADAAVVRCPAGDLLRVPLYLISKIEHAQGDAVVMRDDFEDDRPPRRASGDGRRSHDRAASGEWSFQLRGSGDSLEYKLSEPISSGRAEFWFFDDAERNPDKEWQCELEFASPTSVRPVQVLLGWESDSYGLLAPQGPTLPVQHIERRPGWHRLAVRFSPIRTTILVGNAVLSHGDDGLGHLRAIRFTVRAEGNAAAAAAERVAYVDDLQIAATIGVAVERQPTANQDDLLLDNGDQIFGQLRSATASAVTLHGDFGAYSASWQKLQEINLASRACPTRSLNGQHVRVQFASSGAAGRREANDVLEGVLRALDDDTIAIEHPHIGRVRVLRSQLRELEFFAPGRWIAVDSRFHHFGDHMNVRFQAPYPDGSEREWEFTLDREPGHAALVLHTVGMEAMMAGGESAKRLDNDDWRTFAAINGQKIDPLGLNHLLPNNAKGAVRLVVLLEPGLLKSGKNTLRIFQTPQKNDPGSFDDCGIFGIAIELRDK